MENSKRILAFLKEIGQGHNKNGWMTKKNKEHIYRVGQYARTKDLKVRKMNKRRRNIFWKKPNDILSAGAADPNRKQMDPINHV